METHFVINFFDIIIGTQFVVGGDSFCESRFFASHDASRSGEAEQDGLGIFGQGYGKNLVQF